MSTSRWGLALALSLAGARLAHDAAVPTHRSTVAAAPDGDALRVLSLGRTSTAATATWMWTVLHFISDEPNPDVIERSVLTVGRLDPSHDAAWAYGAMMLASLGDVAGHQRVLRAAIDARPHDPWYPTALAMSAKLDSGDPRQALQWMEWAAKLPNADSLHARLATVWREQLEAP